MGPPSRDASSYEEDEDEEDDEDDDVYYSDFSDDGDSISTTASYAADLPWVRRTRTCTGPLPAVAAADAGFSRRRNREAAGGPLVQAADPVAGCGPDPQWRLHPAAGLAHMAAPTLQLA